uniref:Uncharacterized protein n=1 Tax=Meloidogyne javanica TaxID=6303 RepID=A0A915MTX8_MELJA
MSKFFFPLVFTLASIYFVDTSSSTQSTMTSHHTNQYSSRNGNSRSTGTGVSGVVRPNSERSVNQPGNYGNSHSTGSEASVNAPPNSERSVNQPGPSNIQGPSNNDYVDYLYKTTMGYL